MWLHRCDVQNMLIVRAMEVEVQTQIEVTYMQEENKY